MPETLNHAEEQQLLNSVKKAVDLVEQGSSPDDAIEKIAREESLGPGKIRLVAHAYNNGQQLSQWHRGGQILDKLASFALADPQRVIDRIFHGPTPKEKAAQDAIDPDYHFPPSWLDRRQQEKRAQAPLPLPAAAPLEPYQKDPMSALNRAYGDIEREKKAAEEASRLASRAEDNVRLKVAQLVNYFKQASYSRIPFEYCEHACRSYFGNPSLPLLDIVYKQARLREKRASDKLPVMSNGINLRAEPFTIIREAIKAAEECNRLRQISAQHAEKAKTVKESALRPFSKAGGSLPPAQPSPVLTPGLPSDNRAASIFGVKQAFGLASEVGAIAAGDLLGETAFHNSNLNPENAEKDEQNIADDPAGDDEIGSIRKRVALDTMLADPKNPLSKLPAQDVINVYNDLVKGKPGLADNVTALQPLLEKHFSAALPKSTFEKVSIFDLGMSIGGGMAGRAIGDIPKTKGDLVEDKWLELEDPHHQNELRKIRAHTLLTQLMTDSEDPISGHDPDKVLQAYNELSSVSPRVADNIHTLRPALRRKLEGNQEPFESKELMDIEKGLTATRLPTPSTSALTNAPEKLLG